MAHIYPSFNYRDYYILSLVVDTLVDTYVIGGFGGVNSRKVPYNLGQILNASIIYISDKPEMEITCLQA